MDKRHVRLIPKTIKIHVKKVFKMHHDQKNMNDKMFQSKKNIFFFKLNSSVQKILTF